jgi:hypothetical protein
VGDGAGKGTERHEWRANKFKGDSSGQWRRVRQQLKPGKGVTSGQWCRRRLWSCIVKDHLSIIEKLIKMALGCLQDDATTTNNNLNRRRHQILLACGGFCFSRKSVARGALHPFFAKTPHFPLNQIKLPLRRSPSRLVIWEKFTST